MSAPRRTPRLRRRHVLFFGGFDPKGASYYHALYQRHARLQSAVNGIDFGVGRRCRDAEGSHYWDVRTQEDGITCESRFECVPWDAMVRRHWTRSMPRLVGEMLRAYARMLRHGPRQFLGLRKTMPHGLFAIFYPLLYFAGGLLASALAGLLAGAGAGWLAGNAALGGALGALVFLLGLRLVLKHEQKLQTSLLARIFAFVTRYAVHGMPDLDALLASSARRIAALARAGETDEILVVGYSVGSILATRVMAQALEQLGAAPAPGAAPALALLTLGNCIPLLALFPQAGAYREELVRLGASARIDWVDVSSPTDWASAALQNPLEVCDIAHRTRGRGWPLMTSPRFHKLFSAETYQRMIRDKHHVHTQYLMSTEKPGRYDFFAITAGSVPLAARYADGRRERE